VSYLLDPGPSRKGWHRIQKMIQCPRLFALSYMTDRPKDIKPPAEPLIKGSLLHVGLAHHYALQSEEWADKDLYSPHDSIEVLAQEQPVGHRSAWQRYVPEVQAALADYMLHWAAEQWTPQGIEHELCVNVFDEETNKTYFYTQRVDLVWKHPVTEKIWFVDHKTTGRFTPRTVGEYSMNGQFLGYQCIGQEMFGDMWGGVLLNVIEWSKDGGSPRFERMPIDPAPHAVANFKKTIIRAERTLAKYADTEPAQWPGAHHNAACWPYRKCKFYETCQWGGNS
jgi:hypothetical protein